MSFQKAHVSIVRSIRQVSLLRDWQRTRGNGDLPNIACVRHMLPIYCIAPFSDTDNCPVTLEQIFLPYGDSNGVRPAFMLGALHAWSTEGRFNAQGLLRNVAKVPLHWTVIIDPVLKKPMPPAEEASLVDAVFDIALAPTPAR